jgi:hypothetical protein
MDERLLLDLSSFQKLLEAAWVLQNHRNLPRRDALPPLTAAALEFLSPVLSITARASVRAYETIHADVAIPLAPLAIPIAKSLAAAPAFQLATSATALRLIDAPVPVTANLPATQQHAINTDRPDIALIALPAAKLTLPRSPSVTIRLSPRTRAAAAPATVLLIVVAFLASYFLSYRSNLTPVKAAFQAIGTAIEGTRTNVVEARSKPTPVPVAVEPPQPETSHLRVTDFDSESTVEDLSRFEMQTVRRQAQFGDEDAALTLGLAYEVGSQVPQNCTEAAHWIFLAAEQGNAAAEYNLALRYLYGDGTPASASEARKWFHKAASQGNHDAATALKQGL